MNQCVIPPLQEATEVQEELHKVQSALQSRGSDVGVASEKTEGGGDGSGDSSSQTL